MARWGKGGVVTPKLEVEEENSILIGSVLWSMDHCTEQIHSVLIALDCDTSRKTGLEQFDFFPNMLDKVFNVIRLKDGQLELVGVSNSIQHDKTTW